LSSKQLITTAWQTFLQFVGRNSVDADIPAPWDDPLM